MRVVTMNCLNSDRAVEADHDELLGVAHVVDQSLRTTSHASYGKLGG